MSGYAGTGTVSGGEPVALHSWELTRRPAECVRRELVSLSCCKRQRSPEECTHGLLWEATVASDRADCLARLETAFRIAICAAVL